MSLSEEIRRLAQLKEQGHLSEGEFEAAKQRLLNDSPEPSTRESVQSSRDRADILSEDARPIRRVNGLSIAALILGLIGLGVGHLFALVLGYRAKRQIDDSEGLQSGRGMAIAGIVLGWIGVVAFLVGGTVFLVARHTAQEKVQQTLLSLRDAEDSYGRDNPGRDTLDFRGLRAHGFQGEGGVNVKLYGVRNGGYCAQASGGSLGGIYFATDISPDLVGAAWLDDVEAGKCADTIDSSYLFSLPNYSRWP